MLKLEKVCFRYKEHEVLQDVTFSIKKGEILGLIGDNGAGKSTLMKVICGIRNAESGTISIEGNRVGALIEEPSFYPKMKVKENMEFFRVLYGATVESLEEIMELTGLNKFKNEKSNRLSVGMKKRLGLGIALLSSDKLVLLDEPTSGLDPSGIRDILNLIKKLADEKAISFIISSHIFQDLESICDAYYKLKDKVLFDVYNREDVYGYYVEKDGMASEEIAAYIKEKQCQCNVKNNTVYVKCEVLSQALQKQFHEKGIEIKRRKLEEVYYE
ncbi:ABC transporter ATP-binding protein [Clostridium chrysemydis]|uniref:ABC transporter ATP-binding protein n=1 Tax=Clostridium chrysemydis TaxID=2665504 RepID=UPI0018838CBA|nr:ABC transporter ATP-binding protein [Clostridium chrysemydis]